MEPTHNTEKKKYRIRISSNVLHAIAWNVCEQSVSFDFWNVEHFHIDEYYSCMHHFFRADWAVAGFLDFAEIFI